MLGPEYKSSPARLVRLFRRSRDNWKQRAADKQRALKKLRITVRDLSESRDHWKLNIRRFSAPISQQTRRERTTEAGETTQGIRAKMGVATPHEKEDSHVADAAVAAGAGRGVQTGLHQPIVRHPLPSHAVLGHVPGPAPPHARFPLLPSLGPARLRRASWPRL